MLPYAETTDMFLRRQQYNDIPRDLRQSTLSVMQSAVLPQPPETRLNHQPYGSSSSIPSVRHSDPNIPDTTRLNNCHSTGQTLPGLREILIRNSRTSPLALLSSTIHTPELYYEHIYDEAANQATPGPEAPRPLHSSHSPPSSNGQYAGIHDRRIDPSTSEIRPYARFAGPLLPALPHSIYHMNGSSLAETRYELPQRVCLSSYKKTSSANSCSPITNEEYEQRTSDAPPERLANPRFTPTGARPTLKYLGIKHHPGEGAFHVYEDGYRIPSQVDGVMVNPQWGLTKAKKARKRLAVACLNCRGKKTRCEPGSNGCLQCLKSKRTCRQYVRYP